MIVGSGPTEDNRPAEGAGSATLLTGGTGYLGSLVAATLLLDEARPLVLPIRDPAGAADCLGRLRLALLDHGAAPDRADALLSLVTIAELPQPGCFDALDATATAACVDEVVHCAGCTDYFDIRRLQAGNVALTEDLLGAARRWGVRRFIYMSTAFCSGYRTGAIPERLHDDPAPGNEPTAYTLTKRIAERRIAESGVPFIIIRPSIVIGHSLTGRYRGRNYGLYQIWRAWEALLGPDYSPIWHTVSPPVPLSLLHQDAFQAGFLAIHRGVANDAIVHLVADHPDSPTMRDVCWLWAEVYCPTEIRSYATVDDVPLRSLPTRQRRFLELSAKNLEIATHEWQFETRHLDAMRTDGLVLPGATVSSVARCQRSAIARSPRIQEHMRRCADRAGLRPRFVAVAPRAARLPEREAATHA